MKTLALIILFFAVGFTASGQTDSSRNAFKPQTDTSRNAFRSGQSLVIQNPAVQPTPPVQPQMQYRIEDRILIQHNELPNSLRETLMGNQYKGWENSVIYRDNKSGEYYYNTNIDTQAPPTYMRFDKNGKAIPPAKTGNDGQ